MEQNFALFVKGAWPLLWPQDKLEWLPYLDCICEWLTALREGSVKRLIINQPPQTLKSTLASILFPCWLWTTEPHRRIICSTYGFQALSVPQSVKRRRIILSSWYQSRWPTRMLMDANERWRYYNEDGGHMVATATDSGITGTGADYIIIDDPHNVKEAVSDVEREAGVTFIRETLMTRFSDSPEGRAVLVMHRLHESDATGQLFGLGWKRIAIAARAEETEDLRVELPSGFTWNRPKGDLIEPRRLSEEILVAKQTLELGSRAYSAQYQQRPAPTGGIIFKPEWWRLYGAGSIGFERTAISVDAAFKDTKESHPVAIQAWGLVGPRSYLIEKDTDRRGFAGTKHAIRAMEARYPGSVLLIEDKANGPAIIEGLRQEFSVIAVDPKGGKVPRAEACSPDVEAGNVYLPATKHPETGELIALPWVSALITLLAKFPAVKEDDDIDALTQLLNWRRQRAWGILEVMKKEASQVKPKTEVPDNPMDWSNDNG